jgi:ADP-dependent NAD(P)H-hydrate dehydratase / NAD(P)H-hydrate epimerase
MTCAILTCEEVRAAEQMAVQAGIPLWGLMQKAGQACADVLHAEFPEGRVVVLAGPGNNGGDAYVAAQRLRDLGRNVWVFDLAPRGERSLEGQNALAALLGPRQPLEDLRLAPDDIVLDGLFGAGLSRPLAGEAAYAVEQVNASGVRVVAIDVPSGVNGDAAAVAGPAISADVTVTFCCKKAAHVLQPAAALCGEVVPAEIGFGRFVEAAGGGKLHENSPALWASKLRWPDVNAHKHRRGRLAVVTGPLSSTGAARLSAQAGLRAGAGQVTLLCPPAALIVVAGAVMAPLTASFKDEHQLLALTETADAVVIGPAAGVNDRTRTNVEALAKADRTLVLDADAITVFAGHVETLGGLLEAPAVLTPHMGEFARLFPGVLEEASSKIEAARAAAKQVGAVLLLKGPDSVIAAPDGRAVVNIHASPFLATAGSGDVLAGIIGGLLAQGMEAFDAACAGAWMHGDAGIRAGAGITAEDLDQALRETIRDLYAARAGA